MITVITGRRDTHQVLDARDTAAFDALMERLDALRPR